MAVQTRKSFLILLFFVIKNARTWSTSGVRHYFKWYPKDKVFAPGRHS